MIFQRTIENKIEVTGIGIHSGARAKMTLHPAVQNHGIVFQRKDVPHAPLIKITPHSVSATENNTTVGQGISAIHTVEHLLSALYGLGIDNIFIEVEGPEIPIMDGSAGSFVFLLREAGIQQLPFSRKFIVVKKTIRVEKDGKWASIEPCHEFQISSKIIFAHPVIKTQSYDFVFTCENFIKQISRARTFGFLKDVDMLKRRGLAKGGSLDNAVVLDDYKVINPDGVRFENEFVRHKILDLIGDVSLLGYDLVGKITTYKSGHNLHNLLCRKLIETLDAYEIVSSSTMSPVFKESFNLSQFSMINAFSAT